MEPLEKDKDKKEESTKDKDAERKNKIKDEKAGDNKGNDGKNEDKKKEPMKAKPKTPPASVITHTGLLRLQKKKNKTINLIIISFFIVLAILIFITIVSVRYFMARQKLSKITAGNSTITVVVQESPLKPHFMAMSEKINKLPASKEDIDANITVLKEFVDKYVSSSPTDEWVKQAKEQIKAQEDLKMMY